MKIGDRAQPKGRPELAGKVIATDTMGHGGATIKLFKPEPSLNTHRRYALKNLEPSGGMGDGTEGRREP